MKSSVHRTARRSAAVLLLIVVTAGGCSARAPLPSTSLAPSRLDADIQKRSSALHHYLVGELSLKRDDLPRALDNLEKANQLMESPSPEVNRKLAELELRSGNLSQALVQSERALKGDPANAQILSLHAGILEALGRTGEATEYLRRAAQGDPSSAEIVVLLAENLNRQQKQQEALTVLSEFRKRNPGDVIARFYRGRTFEQVGDLKAAEKELKQAAALQPNNTNLLLEYVRVLLKREKVPEATTLVSQILEKDPDNALARKVLGQLLVGQRKFDEAILQFQALEGTPDEALDARMSIALIEIQRQQFHEAIKQLQIVLAQKPNFAEARYALGTALAGAERPSEAAKELIKIPETDSNFERARTYAGFLFRQAGELDEAESAMRDAIRVSKNNAPLIMYLASILREAQKLDEALDVLQEVVAAEPLNDQLLFDFAMIHHEKGDTDTARGIVEDVLRINAANPEALNYLAYDLAERGIELERAKELVERALTVRPLDGYFLDTLAWIHFKKGEKDLALSTIERAVSLMSDDPVILSHYGDILLAHGRLDEATDVYRRVLALSPQDAEGRAEQERVKELLEELEE